MMLNPAIQNLAASGGIAEFPSQKGAEAKGGEDFGKMLVSALEEVNGAQGEAKSMQQDYLTDRRSVDVHDVMIAQEKASTAFQLTMAVRNKALEAFQEINRLPV